MKYVCEICGYVYDPEKGDPEHGIAPGTKFEDIPEDWACPDCGVDKSFLLRECKKAYEDQTTPSCREHCSGCGANKLGGERTCCPKIKK